MDPTSVTPELFTDAAKLGIGGFVVWLFTSGYISKIIGWFREGRKETREEAKEAPERELKLVKEQLAETKMTVTGLCVKLDEMQVKYHQCEVSHAKSEAKIEMQAQQILALEEKNAEKDKTIEAQQDRIVELEHQLNLQVNKVKLIEFDVAKVKEQQSQ